MSATERLITQHIREYEFRLKHIDELFKRAQIVSEGFEQDDQAKMKLEYYEEQRRELANKADRLRKMPLSNWRKEMIQSSGPMGLWDILAQELEDFVERHERN
ncbi:MAG: hypothetical protein ACC663_01105 [Gammaproteobacteria bacterium]